MIYIITSGRTNHLGLHDCFQVTRNSDAEVLEFAAGYGFEAYTVKRKATLEIIAAVGQPELASVKHAIRSVENAKEAGSGLDRSSAEFLEARALRILGREISVWGAQRCIAALTLEEMTSLWVMSCLNGEKVER